MRICSLYFAMTCLSAISINVEGLHNDQKRQNIFKFILKEKFDIIAIQETHCTENVVQKWKNEWPGESAWSVGGAHSAGVAFLFGTKHNTRILDEDLDTQARILRVTAEIDNKTLELINIYAYKLCGC